MAFRPPVTPWGVILFLPWLLQSSMAAEPGENTIPVLAIRAASGPDFSKVTLPMLCTLSWMHVHGVDVGGPVLDGSAGTTWEANRRFMEHCGEAGMLLALGPWELCQFYNPWNEDTAFWFRLSDRDLTSDSCFAQAGMGFDSLRAFLSAEEMADPEHPFSIAAVVRCLAELLEEEKYSALWFYNVYDEAPGWQRRRMMDASPWSGFIPNVFTQDRDSLSTYPVTPTLAEVEPSGLFSWTKWFAENHPYHPVPLTLNLLLIQTIGANAYSDWGGNAACAFCAGSLEQHAVMVNALCETRFQGPPTGSGVPDPVDNFPKFLTIDDYPFRYVDMIHADSTTLCDPDWLFLIDHYEEALDTTVITAKKHGIPIHLYLQTFGAAGGDRLLDSLGNLHYPHFLWRIPTPAEVRMYAHLALLHQVKGLHLYSLASYIEVDDYATDDFISSALLDINTIPFDAPFEDWVYTGRHEALYADPRNLPPFREGFDPLFTLPPPPILPEGDPKNRETWYTWLFQPYGRLFREIGGILGEVAVMAPELTCLEWWEGESTRPGMEPVGNPPVLYAPPRIRMFRRTGRDQAYLFYVNRHLRSPDFRYRIGVDGEGFSGMLSTTALDHGRRCLVPVAKDGDEYFLFDTLEAGQARLLEFMDVAVPRAEIRVTSPDVFLVREGSLERTGELRCFTGETVELGAVFYNMGTASTGDVRVTFVHVSHPSSPDTLGSDTFRLPGLSGWFSPDSVSASMVWNPDLAFAGPNIIEISASSVLGENTSDNTVRVVVLVDPRDYATEVLGDPWDMTEAGSSPPDWYTPDVASVSSGWDPSCWTDSISGMFEGALSVPGPGNLFRGDIYLREDEQEPIDADRYTLLSLAGVSLNPNTASREYGCGMFLLWTDSTNTVRVHPLHEEEGFGKYLGNGRDMWRVLGPLDLDGVEHWGGEVRNVGIRFQMDTPPSFPLPIGIRLGRITLEEAGS